MRRALAAHRPPDDVRTVVGDAHGEHLLAWGRDRDGAALVATTAGLWGYGERLAWHEIDRAVWADDVLTLLAVDGEARPVPLAEPRDLPAVVKAQVEASVLHSRAVALLPDGRGVTVVARRIGGPAGVGGSAGSGRVDWRLHYDAGVPVDDLEVRARAESALREVRRDLGI